MIGREPFGFCVAHRRHTRRAHGVRVPVEHVTPRRGRRIEEVVRPGSRPIEDQTPDGRTDIFYVNGVGRQAAVERQPEPRLARRIQHEAGEPLTGPIHVPQAEHDRLMSARAEASPEVTLQIELVATIRLVRAWALEGVATRVDTRSVHGDRAAVDHPPPTPEPAQRADQTPYLHERLPP